MITDVDLERIKKISPRDGEKVAAMVENMNKLIELKKKSIKVMEEMIQAVLSKTIFPDGDEKKSYSVSIENVPGKGSKPRFIIRCHDPKNKNDIKEVDFDLDEMPKIMFDRAYGYYERYEPSWAWRSRIKKQFNKRYADEQNRIKHRS